MVRRLAPIALALVAVAIAAPAANADPPATNPNAHFRTFTSCDNGETNVEVVFAGGRLLNGSNYNVTSDQRVFVFKSYAENGVVLVERGIKGVGHAPLTECTYTTPTGAVATVIGFFTQRGH